MPIVSNTSVPKHPHSFELQDGAVAIQPTAKSFDFGVDTNSEDLGAVQRRRKESLACAFRYVGLSFLDSMMFLTL